MNKDGRPYAGRLKSERARLGLSQAQLSVAGSVSKTTQVGYEGDAHVPDLEYVDDVEKLGVDKILMCTGMPEAEFVASRFNWELHRDILVAIAQWTDEHGVRIPAEKMADLIHLLYDDSIETRTIEPATLARALRLVA